MVDTTIFEKISLIFNLLKENSMIALIILLTVVIIMDLLYGKNSKNTKKLYFVIIILLVVYGLFTYYKPFINIMDTYIANIFRVAYFPSIIDYITMLIITLIIQIVSSRKSNKLLKNINIWVGIIIEVLFIVNLIAMNNITVDLSSLTSIYENEMLLAIFQLTGIIFVLWIIFNIISYIIILLLNKKIEIPKLNKDYE